MSEIEMRLLLEAIYEAYHYDFRQYAVASLKRRLAQALVRFDCHSLSARNRHQLGKPAQGGGTAVSPIRHTRLRSA